MNTISAAEMMYDSAKKSLDKAKKDMIDSFSTNANQTIRWKAEDVVKKEFIAATWENFLNIARQATVQDAINDTRKELMRELRSSVRHTDAFSRAVAEATREAASMMLDQIEALPA